jgi:hypothetical protein
VTDLLPPLDLAVETTDAGGVRYRWDSSDRYAGNRPQGLSFSTKRGEGFADGSVTLARRIDRDYVDLHLFDDVAFIGADGSVAYEGRVGAQPRSVKDAHSISVQCAGHMAHARDRPFSEVYVDRDLSAWQVPSRARQVSLLASNWGMGTGQSVMDASAFPALQLQLQGSWSSPFKPLVEMWYDAGPSNRAGIVYFSSQGTAQTTATFELYVLSGTTDNTVTQTSTDQWAGTNTETYFTFSAGRRYCAFEWLYNTTPAGADGADFSMFLQNVAVYGDHGLPTYGADPRGVLASDVMRDIASRFCPQLSTAGVQNTEWPIPHLVFKDPTDPYDAFLELNKFHLWELGVWENKTLTFAPADRTDYDWEIRLSDFGVEVDLQGDSTENLANGIIVNYQNVATGVKDTLFPDSYTDLADSNPDSPINQHGLTRWTKLDLSSPTTADAAVQIGRAALLEYNQPKAPGTITITGHVRDRAGHWQQGWKVRAGDTVSITDHPNDSPRLVTETSWNHDSKQLSITVDSTAQRLDAVIDRIGTALTAAGLT